MTDMIRFKSMGSFTALEIYDTDCPGFPNQHKRIGHVVFDGAHWRAYPDGKTSPVPLRFDIRTEAGVFLLGWARGKEDSDD